MTTQVKICGITRVQDAVEAVRLGASAIGMIFVPSERVVDTAAARDICHALPPYVDRVGVFADQPLAKIERVLDAVPLTRVQLHGHEEPAMARDLPGALTRTLIYLGNDPRHQIQPWVETRPDTQFLVDLPKEGEIPEEEELWGFAGELSQQRPLTLAGGLHPDNVVRALERVRPAAVDVSRGVERSPGVKDPGHLQAFCRAVRKVDAARRGDP